MTTARLVLRPLPAAAAAVLPLDREAASAIIGAALPAAWPQVDLLDVLPSQAAAEPPAERFGIWSMVERASGLVVGDVGFHGPPEDGIVEMGFSVIPERRRRGYATEAVRAVAAWAVAEAGVRDVVARCEPDNVASIGVLESVGFVRTEVVDGLVGWRLLPEGAARGDG